MTEVMNAFGMSINEHLGCLKLSGIIEAKSEKSSEQIENMIRGGYAMMKMSLPQDQNIDSMIRDFSIQRNDSTLHLIWKYRWMRLSIALKKKPKRRYSI